MTILNLFLALC